MPEPHRRLPASSDQYGDGQHKAGNEFEYYYEDRRTRAASTMHQVFQKWVSIMWQWNSDGRDPVQGEIVWEQWSRISFASDVLEISAYKRQSELDQLEFKYWAALEVGDKEAAQSYWDQAVQLNRLAGADPTVAANARNLYLGEQALWAETHHHDR